MVDYTSELCEITLCGRGGFLYDVGGGSFGSSTKLSGKNGFSGSFLSCVTYIGISSFS